MLFCLRWGDKMNKKAFKLRRRVPWLTMGLLGLPFMGNFVISGEFFMPKAAAFTTPVSDQTITGETVADGAQEINSGGIANDTIVDLGGIQYVNEGGITHGTILNPGGTQIIDDGGTANVTTIEESGYQVVYGGGISNDAIINAGGSQELNSGTSNRTIINSGGNQDIYYGSANETIINDGGVQNVGDDGITNDTIIKNGGIQNVDDRGIANDTVVDLGGIQYVNEGGVAHNSSANDGGAIYITENGTNLTGITNLNGGTLHIVPASVDGSSFIVSNIENLAGNGSIYLNTNLESLTGDLVQISGSASGDHQVFANNQGGASVDKDQALTIIETAGGGNFSLGQQVEVGGYLYDLRKNPGNQNNWELYSPGNHTSSGSASINAFAGSYLLNYAETQTLLQRMGDLRQGDDQGGVWARALGGKFESNGSSFLSGFDMNYSGLQVGSDKKISLKNGKGDLYVGGMFGYSKGNLDYGVGSGSIDSKTLGAYGTYIAPNGFYADLALKYGWMKNDFKVLDTAGNRVTGEDMNTDGLSASLEVGQKIHFNKTAKEGWYVEPQAQISMGHQSGGSFHASNGLRVDVDSYTSTLGRLGINAGYEVKSGKNPVNVYAKASYVHEFDGDVGYRMNGIAEQTSFGDSWWTYGVGITAQINKKHNVYLDIERASGGQFSQPWSLNGGYRFSW